MTSPLASQERSAFNSAAVLGHYALDARERTARRFGADADSRWTQFTGALDAGDRIDSLLRDAARKWGAAFSPSECFGFFGLADDDPFGPDWGGIADHAAKKLLADPSGSPTVDSVADAASVPKERFVTVPGCNTDEDTTPLAGWAGWDHLHVTQAISGLYQRRKAEDDWQKDRLVPLLAGIDERMPGLLQRHNEPSAGFGGMMLGEFFRDFVAGEAHSLGVAVGDLRTWTPPVATKRTTVDPSEVLAVLESWKPDIDEDDEADEAAELPESPTEVALASAVGVSKTFLSKVLKKLVADGVVENGVAVPRGIFRSENSRE